MRYIELLNESTPRTLYHGTLVDNLPEIMRNGIEPRVGAFVDHFYGGDEDELEHLVFAADRDGLMKCVSAILGYLRFVKRIPANEENFFQYGAIVVLKGENDKFIHTGNDDEEDWMGPPTQVEPGDYYSREAILPSFAYTGKKLKKFLDRNFIVI